MTTTTVPRRPVVGAFYALAGLLILAQIAFQWLDPTMSPRWLVILTDGAMTLAFLFVAVGKAAPHLTRVFSSVAAIGWGLSVVGAVGWANGGSDLLSSVVGFVTTTVVIAIVGSLGSGILSFAQHVFSRVANLVFLIAMIMTSVVLSANIYPVLAGSLADVVNVLFGLGLLAAGLIIAVPASRSRNMASHPFNPANCSIRKVL